MAELYIFKVIMWPEAVERMNVGDSPRTFDSQPSAWHQRHVVITGRSGAGKTRLLSTLTGRSLTDGRSTSTEAGFMRVGKKRIFHLGHAFDLITIPGREGTQRTKALEKAFSSRAKLHGVIFVASAGYDHIWSENADQVAEELRKHWTYDIAGLKARNQDLEQEAFKETCRLIQQKIQDPETEYRPRWLLVLVNKADLYWKVRSTVENYYLPGAKSKFDTHRQDLFAAVGNDAIHYYVLPLVTSISNYRFQPSSAAIPATTDLEDRNRYAAISSLAANLEGLYDAR